jgi:coproporphyrinogen III oxidase
MPEINTYQQNAAGWFATLRDRICATFEALEDDLDRSTQGGRFERKSWQREGGGGGEMSIMRGRVFEKVGVNISTVHGEFSETMRKEIPGANDKPYFWASGISLVAHMHSPLVPAVHMNTRMIVVSDSVMGGMLPPASLRETSPAGSSHSAPPRTHAPSFRHWFGGGTDLTPMFPDEKDVRDFHVALKNTCDRFSPEYYPKYKKWCDEYFYLKHRNEPRGAGGIFYDYLDTGDFEKDFAFTQSVGETFHEIYPKLVRRHMHEKWSLAQREQQLVKRGRYVEFNLLYDRGTKFGLMTGGNTEAILMSLPPEVRWP